MSEMMAIRMVRAQWQIESIVLRTMLLSDFDERLCEHQPEIQKRGYSIRSQFAKALRADNVKKFSEEHCGYFCFIAATTWSALDADFRVESKSVMYCRVKARAAGLFGRPLCPSCPATTISG